jgi:hypothetical protein
MLLDNVSLGVKRQDFQSSTKGIQQDSKEESRSSCSERIGCSS